VAYRNKFLDMKNLPTCIAPWHALTIKWGGNVVPDIIYKDKLGNINDYTLKEIWEGPDYRALRESHRNRQIPPSCANCAKKEKSGRSRRMYFWDKLDYDLRMESETLDVDSTPDIRYLDFTLSNKCNLACIHCGPFVSTGWTKDGKKLNKEMPEYWNKQPIGFNGVKELGFMDNLFANPEYFKNLQWVALRGGEPLYDERCYEVLKWFVDNGIAKNVALDISTNGTVFEDRFKEIFKEFKHIELLISIEATDDLYSVIRGGDNYSWDDLNDNLAKFYAEDNVEITFAVTVMTTNIFNLDKVWDWFYTNHRKRASISMTNVVVTPAYLNIAHMPRELKNKALEKMEHIPSMEMWPISNSRVDMFEYQTGIDDIRAGLRREVDEEEASKYWDWFLKYTKDLDRLRNTDTFNSIPEMKNYK
jgi:MoaA/NifB/PqqE/SkfB family radical SAM enzyme